MTLSKMHPDGRQASRVLKHRASTILSPRNYFTLMGIGIAGVLLRYGAYYFETGDFSLTHRTDSQGQRINLARASTSAVFSGGPGRRALPTIRSATR
jgi:hypothetical protein